MIFSIIKINLQLLSSTVPSKIDFDQNISISITTDTNTIIIDNEISNNTLSGYLDLGDLNSEPMRPILKVSIYLFQIHFSYYCSHILYSCITIVNRDCNFYLKQSLIIV